MVETAIAKERQERNKREKCLKQKKNEMNRSIVPVTHYVERLGHIIYNMLQGLELWCMGAGIESSGSFYDTCTQSALEEMDARTNLPDCHYGVSRHNMEYFVRTERF